MKYLPPDTVFDFIDDQTTFVRGLMGPVGSGKSVGCVHALLHNAGLQRLHKGKRRYRAVIVRNSYRELQDTTLATWFDWVPKTAGKWVAGDMKFVWAGADFEFEFLFRALDRPDDVKKLLSLELTDAWVNEAREIPLQVIEMLQARVGRYPAKRDGGPTRYGLVMDTNPPDVDSWWHRYFEELRPEGWKLYRQPAGDGPNAENVENLPDGYYQRIAAGKSAEWRKVYVGGEYGYIADGRPVYPEFNDQLHYSDARWHGGDIFVGIDFGLTPAAVIYQVDPGDKQVQAVGELVTENMGAERFGGELGKLIRVDYNGAGTRFWGDPAGEGRAQTDERTPFDVLRANGIDAYPAIAGANANDFTLRRESVAGLLTRLTVKGRPALVIGPGCPQLRKAMSGGYAFRRLQVSGRERYTEVPDKNHFSHVADAGQYGLVGEGYHRHVIEPPESHRLRRRIKAKRSIGRSAA